MDRRELLRWAALGGAAAILPGGCSRQGAPVDDASAPLRFPGKVAMKIVNDRPPCLESPWSAYQHDLTPNDAFYVRWHLQFTPTTVDLRTWRLKLGGHVERVLEWSMADLRRMKPTSVVAVNQCSGNSRGLFQPPVPGAQWGNGGMGNARWTGVPLGDLLRQAGVKAGAVDVAFAALDRGGYSTVPDFTKSLSVEKALDPTVLVVYEMNGDPLPLLNGFPVRLVVCGWYATYWVKALTEITVLPHRFDGFWVSKAYRIPTTANAVESPTALAAQTVPINRMNVRSFFVRPEPGTSVSVGAPCLLDGIAFDGGSGIQRVEVSTDGGTSWRETELGRDLGPYSFRRWRLNWRPEQVGQHRLLVRATSRSGETQPATAGWNRAGYMRNVIEEMAVDVK
jgi:DMSO/TMAO reductase YedYZ molybdopterin-dependent catalytic subunit